MRKRRSAAFRFSDHALFENLPATFRTRLYGGKDILRLLVLALLILALSRPQLPLWKSTAGAEGIDIVLAVDVSSTMLAENFETSGKKKSRIDAVKEVVGDFIRSRKDDRLGIVAFASNAAVVAPLTLDHGWLSRALDMVKPGVLDDGTAIGSGLTCALARLKDSRTATRVVILLTDGRNNSGAISPLDAAAAARALNIRIYTIAAGSKTVAGYPGQSIFGSRILQRVRVEPDQELLRQIAENTRGKYFRAENGAALREIYREIDGLEKSHIEERKNRPRKELFVLLLIPALLLLIAEVVVNNTVLRRIP